MNELEQYYLECDEDGRLLSQHGQVEYLTTMHYIHTYLQEMQHPQILEVGAATGRYSIALAKEGCSVTAADLLAHNLDILKSKLDGTEPIQAVQANALDLSRFPDNTFDMTLLLGPMYHLYTKADMLRALSEAVRVTKEGGYILAAYCMNEIAVLGVFRQGRIREITGKKLITADWHCVDVPEEIFAVVRTEEIDELNRHVPADRVKLIASDGQVTNLRDMIDALDAEEFALWMQYHLATCERPDLLGASNHTLDILRKRTGA